MLRVASIFSGIGGFELGLRDAGFETIFQCEISEQARAILNARFPGVSFKTDITKVRSLPKVDVVAAGFPCQDLSQAGRAQGIRGINSSLVNYVFDLIAKKREKPNWIVLENVPFMLQLENGQAINTIVKRVESIGYRWAYRIVDLRAFGLPQRRRRVVFVASLDGNPSDILLSDEVKARSFESPEGKAHGFYWTEGRTGLGWTFDGIPTLKAGSTLGIPSPPAIWLSTESQIVTPNICDAERLQGFEPNWTFIPGMDSRTNARWKLVGNAFPVPISRWLGNRITSPRDYDASGDSEIDFKKGWPNAAWGEDGRAFESKVNEWPVKRTYRTLDKFLRYPTSQLSLKATKGFYSRASKSNLKFFASFLSDVESHLERLTESAAM